MHPFEPRNSIYTQEKEGLCQLKDMCQNVLGSVLDNSTLWERHTSSPLCDCSSVSRSSAGPTGGGGRVSWCEHLLRTQYYFLGVDSQKRLTSVTARTSVHIAKLPPEGSSSPAPHLCLWWGLSQTAKPPCLTMPCPLPVTQTARLS